MLSFLFNLCSCVKSCVFPPSYRTPENTNKHCVFNMCAQPSLHSYILVAHHEICTDIVSFLLFFSLCFPSSIHSHSHTSSQWCCWWYWKWRYERTSSVNSSVSFVLVFYCQSLCSAAEQKYIVCSTQCRLYTWIPLLIKNKTSCLDFQYFCQFHTPRLSLLQFSLFGSCVVCLRLSLTFAFSLPLKCQTWTKNSSGTALVSETQSSWKISY